MLQASNSCSTSQATYMSTMSIAKATLFLLANPPWHDLFVFWTPMTARTSKTHTTKPTKTTIPSGSVSKPAMICLFSDHRWRQELQKLIPWNLPRTNPPLQTWSLKSGKRCRILWNQLQSSQNSIKVGTVVWSEQFVCFSTNYRHRISCHSRRSLYLNFSMHAKTHSARPQAFI